jgi:hypothetical protein
MGDLRAELEGAYARFKTALRARDEAAVRAMIAPPGLDALLADPAEWPDLAEQLDDDFPDLSEVRVVAVREKGEWSGLYLDLCPDDPESADVLLVAFQRTTEGLKIAALYAGALLKRGPDVDLSREIERERDLLLPGESEGKD